MPYATRSDCVARRGEGLVSIVEDGDQGRLDLALGDATAEIDSYIGARHGVPLDPVPAVVKRFCVDIALHLCADTADRSTEEMEARYKRAIAWLRDVSRGSVSLGPRDPDPPERAGAGSVTGSPRVFSRESMRGFLV